MQSGPLPRRTVAACGATALAGVLALGAIWAGMLTSGAQAQRPPARSLTGLRLSWFAQSERTRAGTQFADAVAPVHPPAAAVLERCMSAADPLERYATFAGRMVALPGSTGMAMRIEVEQRAPARLRFQRVEEAGAPDISAWRASEPGVRIFKDVKQVSNLATPFEYRALVRFRWIASNGSVMRREALRTAICRQAAHPGEGGGSGQGGSGQSGVGQAGSGQGGGGRVGS